MGDIGLGVMINMLGGNEETVKAISESVGKTIQTADMKDDALIIGFADNTKLRVWDDGQSCCESRYMMTDDNPSDFVGSTFIGMELRDAPKEPSEHDGEHEVQFLLVNTSKGTFTLATHNEYNGYYGGFWICARKTDNA